MNKHTLGHLYENEKLLVFFGDRRSTREAVEQAFGGFRILTIKQTHSDVVITSPYAEPGPEADAHYSRDQKLALCVRTADCTPVLIHDPVSGLIAAIHAGWRGVENEIVLKTCEALATQGARLENAEAWCGPHIGPESFEVGLDVADKLEATFKRVARHSPLPSSRLPHDDPTKARVALKTIVRAQLISKGFQDDRIHELAIDTVRSFEHESYRRDRDRAGRQISFIALKK
jgi:YfiH family protein